MVIHSNQRDIYFYQDIKRQLGIPMFVKPANTGSSVGISRITCNEEYDQALDLAFRYDHKVIIEEGIDGREIECSVLGNEDPVASLPGEIIMQNEDDFYSYEAKYIDENRAKLSIPAKLSQDLTKKIQDMAVTVYKASQCVGMARIDFFIKKNNEIIVNEINTIPGFTNISMYPKLWETSGIPLPELLDKLIDLAFLQFSKDKKLVIDYQSLV